jgi:hypothetical protein
MVAHPEGGRQHETAACRRWALGVGRLAGTRTKPQGGKREAAQPSPIPREEQRR